MRPTEMADDEEQLAAAIKFDSYSRLRKRVFLHLADHPQCFARLRPKDLRVLDRYFLIVNGPGAATDAALGTAFARSQELERQDPRLRVRVLRALAKVDGFEP